MTRRRPFVLAAVGADQCGGAWRVRAVGRTGRHRFGGRLGGIDAARALVGETLREQLSQRHVDEGWVTDPPVAIGIGQSGGLEIAVQRLSSVQRSEVAAFEDVQCFTHRRAAGGRRCHPGHGQPAVVDQCGCPEQGAVPVQVSPLHQAWPDHAGGGRVNRRLLHRRNDLLAETPLVEIVRAAPAQQGVGTSQVRVAQHRTHRRWRTAGEEQLPGAGKRCKAFGVVRSLLTEGLIDDESLAGELSRRA